MHRLALEVRQRVVHPAEVPLVAEAKPTVLGWTRDAAPRGRLLGDRLDVRERAVHRAIQLLQKADRVAIVIAAVFVRYPLARFARIVAVQHRRDAVDAQAIDVIAVEPTDRRRDQKRAHLVATVVEDVARPIGMKTALRIRVLEQVRAIELAEPVRIGRKVRGNPIEDHADPRAMELVDHRHEIVRCAVPRGRREEAGDLVAPRSVEWMLHHGHQLDVRESECRTVCGELCTEIAIPEHFVVATSPRAEMHFVDADR